MPTVDVYNQNREKVGTADLPDAVFGAEVKEHLLYAAVRYQRAAARQGTHKAKERAEVRGGGKKPWRQKGTGRARQGSTRSPQWRGGGVVFGPRVRSHAHKLNKKVRKAALCSALSRRCEESRVVVLDELSFEQPKTRQVVDLMQRFELGDMLLVATADDNVVKSARNLSSVTVLPPEGVNVYDVLKRSVVVVTKDAAEALGQRLGD
jgi:large subunit ribosomal protein L4